MKRSDACCANAAQALPAHLNGWGRLTFKSVFGGGNLIKSQIYSMSLIIFHAFPKIVMESTQLSGKKPAVQWSTVPFKVPELSYPEKQQRLPQAQHGLTAPSVKWNTRLSQQRDTAAGHVWALQVLPAQGCSVEAAQQSSAMQGCAELLSPRSWRLFTVWICTSWGPLYNITILMSNNGVICP